MVWSCHTSQEASRYKRRLTGTVLTTSVYARWNWEYIAYLRRVVAYADEHLRSLPVRFLVCNDGNHVAEVIGLDVAFPEGILARRRSDLPPRPQEPEQPMPEFQRLTASLQAHSLGPNDMWQRAPENFQVVHGCRGPIFNEQRPNAVRYAIDQLVHHDEITLPSATLTVPQGWRGDTIPVSCRVLSRQQRDSVRIALSLTVTDITTRNPWAVLDAWDNARRRA